mmetsp:Transcript_54672/g.81175  ORF Transcript_54672/g.81175 Transcript_54672/m.81175 type:complete len:451 (+) Transcript_54672:44-1396(+)|eukprot:CAMPEP_0195518414 /NCGR_PEP_ID=MMETSP0794_2-20130614/12837_1 /TAXON_ID=515487 /ORGANISM="Stephanopyxis turris, Strain CCMP 815" /LENGTH=450 /DNA_ID=CAMNT_0040647369 /DNA_START=38 /DNA_END=1390 /DNA_ORIENTATION=+
MYSQQKENLKRDRDKCSSAISSESKVITDSKDGNINGLPNDDNADSKDSRNAKKIEGDLSSAVSSKSTPLTDKNDDYNTRLVNTAKNDSRDSKKAKKRSIKFRKAPQAPKRGKSAFIHFSMAKHAEARKAANDGKNREKVPETARRISQEWRNMMPVDRKYWYDKADRDKKRYEMEKSTYTGPWKLPAGNKRAKKDPNAPKRSMSAFLDYSKKMRRQVKKDNPGMSNINVSKILAEMWKNAPEHERASHIEKEAKERALYKVAIAKWRKKRDNDLKAERDYREKNAMDAVDYYEQQPDVANQQYDQTSFHSQRGDMLYRHPNEDYSNGTYNPMVNNNMMHQNPHAAFYNGTGYYDVPSLEGMGYNQMPSKTHDYYTSSTTGVNLVPEPMPYISVSRESAPYTNHAGRQAMTHDNELQQPWGEGVNSTGGQMMIQDNSSEINDLVYDYTTQ